MKKKTTGAEYRVSVRAMVEYTLGATDITPGASVSDMQAGGRAHRTRQSVKGKGYVSEAPVQLTRDYLGARFRVTGRVDLLAADQELTHVEEIKLCGVVPERPLPAHRAQAVCYAAMLAETSECPLYRVCVTYVNDEGDVRALFEETLEADTLACEFNALFEPWARWQLARAAWITVRDESVRALAFPYAAYRPGQRDMAVQVYTAIRRGKRLYAVMPTGTGKSAAALFPAVKALAEGLTSTVFCLTARGTAQQSALDALDAMRARGLRVRAVQIAAKEKLCPMEAMRCNPDDCPRARGHYERQRVVMQQTPDWDDWRAARIIECANEYALCPFEFTLSLAETADVVICDYNYAFDPMVRIQRIFEQRHDLTLLCDEAHHLCDRARESLSGTLSAWVLSDYRRACARVSGRKTRLYRCLTALLNALKALSEDDEQIPEPLLKAAGELPDAIGSEGMRVPGSYDRLRDALMFSGALNRKNDWPDDYRVIISREGRLNNCTVLCLDPAPHLKAVTQKLAGCVFYSATLAPLDAMRGMMGGDEEDALLMLPSPFPPEHFLVMRMPLSTRYRDREHTARAVAQAIAALYRAQRGKYIAFFSSYAYMELVLPYLEDCHPLAQARRLDDSARAAFLDAFTEDDEPLLGLCVLGGVFSEGVDLPGRRLIGACVVGVGLPMVDKRQEMLRAHYNATCGQGFAFAYRYPGMHKVLQAVGRVIRSPQDKGTALLIDDRYLMNDYETLLPPHWRLETMRNADEVAARAAQFWRPI